MRLAIPNKGVLYAPTMKLLEAAGLGAGSASKRNLYSKSKNGKLSLLFARVQDIPLYVETGAADAGITGLDMVREKGRGVTVLCKLDYGRCRISIAVPQSSGIRSLSDLDGKRIATKLPNTARNYFEKEGIKVELLELAGATELAPNIGVADAIVDHVTTGATLEANGLRELGTITESVACLIASENSIKELGSELEELRLSFEGISRAKSMRYVMMNVTSEENLKRVIACLPSMESPTVLQLAKAGEYAIHTVLQENEQAGLLPKLKRAGAKDILVLSMEQVIP